MIRALPGTPSVKTRRNDLVTRTSPDRAGSPGAIRRYSRSTSSRRKPIKCRRRRAATAPPGRGRTLGSMGTPEMQRVSSRFARSVQTGRNLVVTRALIGIRGIRQGDPEVFQAELDQQLHV